MGVESIRHHAFTSTDGARIDSLTMGDGPAVIVIPGALSVAAGYAGFGHALGEHFTVYIIERRGRGLSSPQSANYSMHIECEDVRALQRETHATLLVGHSFGGLIALEAARNNRSLTRLAVYEPGVSIDDSIAMTWMPAYEKKLMEHRNLDAFVEYSIATGPDRARSMPRWIMKLLMPLFLSAADRRTMLSLLPENLREHREIALLDGSVEHYREISAETLLLSGGKTGIGWIDVAMARLRAVIPSSRSTTFPALDHFGIDKKAPALVARAVDAFFRGAAQPYAPA